MDLHGERDASQCYLSASPRFEAADGFGRMVVNGFGRINGQRMMQAFTFAGKPVWADPANGVLNGYGSVYTGFRTLADAEAHTRWRILSGLLELSTAVAPAAATAAASDDFAIDVSELTVAWGTKRGDGAIRLQFPRVPLRTRGAGASNRPVKMFDVKTPAAWVDAADGPRVTADGSSLSFLWQHHADDNLKVDSSFSRYEHVTLVQGDVGSAVELGTYGIGLRGGTVRGSSVEGVYVHRVTQASSMDDQLGSLVGSRTCPWGIILRDLSVRTVYVPRGLGNQLDAPLKLGVYGESKAPYPFAANTSLDRWFFCSNSWWLDDQTIRADVGQIAARFANLSFVNWRIGPTPAAESWLYNFDVPASAVVEGLVLDSGRVGGYSNLSGIVVL